LISPPAGGIVTVAIALFLVSCDPRAAEAPSVVDHSLLHRARDGHLAGAPVAVAGVRCFQQIPRSPAEGVPARVDWFYCTIDRNMDVGALRTLSSERTEIKVGPATVTVHAVTTERRANDDGLQLWTLRRVDVTSATVKVLGSEFRGWPGYRIGYVMSEDGRGGMYGRTVFELRDPKTKEFVGALAAIVITR
jgi:hypothetical protein